MLNDYKKRLALLAIAVFPIMMGCQKEEEPLDLELPGVTLEVSGNPAKLYNEVALTSTATDNGTIERVVFYVNSDSIGQATTEPYELTWNSKEVEDGPYMLKAVAYDASGNKSEAAKEVTIKNTLLVMHVKDGYFQPREGVTREHWVFLSDKQGNVVGEAKQIMNGESLRWERPSDFYSDTLYLSRLHYNNYTYNWTPKVYTYVDIYTYADFTLEEAYLGANNSPDSVGKVDITVENSFSGADSYLYETRLPYHRGSSLTSNAVATYSVIMGENSQKGFSSYGNWSNMHDQSLREKYYRFEDLEAGNSYTFHTDDYTAMEEHIISFPFVITDASVSTTGYLNKEESRGYSLDYTSVWDSQGQELKAFSANDFPYIRTHISARTGNKSFYMSTLDKTPVVSNLPEFSAKVESSDMKNITVTTNGVFDVGNGFWEYKEDTETLYLMTRRGFYFSSESGASYVLPEVPTSLLERFPALNKPMDFSYSWAYDNKAFNSYEERLAYLFTDNYSGLDFAEYSGISIYPESAGGRLLPTREAKFTQEEREQEHLWERGIFMH